MISIFIHIACMGEHWRSVVSELSGSIINSGLYQHSDFISLHVTGTEKDFAKLKLEYQHFEKINFSYHGNNFDDFEFPTVIGLSEFCRINPNAKVLYCHSKGVSKDCGDPFAKYWRRYMIQSCIVEHQKHLSALDTHDVSGNMWTDNKHFSGNFWWANAGHINALPSIMELRQNPVVVWDKHSYRENLRLQCEMWIGMKPNIHLKEQGILNMKPGFAHRIVGNTDPTPCPLNIMEFDRIYLINMDERTDRLQQTMDRMEHIGLKNVIRFPAINARKLGITKKDLDNPGLIGCFMSHFFILQEAVINQYSRILIFEDDVTFVNGFNEIMDYALKQLPVDWQLVYLGYTERNGIESYKQKISANITEPNDPWGTQAYMLQGEGIEIMYNNLKEIRDHIDLQMSRQICPKLKAYQIFPSVCPQSNATSDIRVGNVNMKIAGRKGYRAVLN